MNKNSLRIANCFLFAKFKEMWYNTKKRVKRNKYEYGI